MTGEAGEGGAMPPDADSETRDTNDAFRPSSLWWGSMLCPVAVVVGKIDLQADLQHAMNAEIAAEKAILSEADRTEKIRPAT